MPNKKKKVSQDKSRPAEDNNGNNTAFTKDVPAATQQRPNTTDFDFENFSDFFDCKTTSVKQFYDVGRESDEREKCSHCKKGSADLKKCTECKAVFYCNRTCQKADWPLHKIFCRKSKSDEAVSSKSNNSTRMEEEKDSGVHMKGDSSSKLCEKSACSNCNRLKDVLKTCVRCKNAVYCDKQCQKDHWPVHKKSCGKAYKDKENAALTGADDSFKSFANLSSSQDNRSANRGSDEPNMKCLFCKKKNMTFARCSKCQIAVYCDEKCMESHRLAHEVACENFPKFFTVLENASEIIADYHGCKSTQMVLPPPPDHSLGQRDGIAVLLKIVEQGFHPFRHSIVVQDVKGEKAPMLFYHEPESERMLLPRKLEGVLTPGNFIRWFRPRWHLFLDGTVGFRIDTLEELELLRSVTRLTFGPM